MLFFVYNILLRVPQFLKNMQLHRVISDQRAKQFNHDRVVNGAKKPYCILNLSKIHCFLQSSSLTARVFDGLQNKRKHHCAIQRLPPSRHRTYVCYTPNFVTNSIVCIGLCDLCKFMYFNLSFKVFTKV